MMANPDGHVTTDTHVAVPVTVMVAMLDSDARTAGADTDIINECRRRDRDADYSKNSGTGPIPEGVGPDECLSALPARTKIALSALRRIAAYLKEANMQK